MFNSGLRPAINAGISVSRVGSAAQTKAIKKVAGKVKLELAQFDELQAFAQFASDLDPATQAQLAKGQRLREILKQQQYSPRSLAEQVAVIYAGVNDMLNDIPVDKVADYVSELIAYVNTSKKAYVDEINNTKKLTDDAVKLLEEAIDESKQAFMAA